MNYLSVCSGIEAASVAWRPLDWQPHAFAEIDAFPSAVLAVHHPDIPNRGDITKFQEWPDAAIDLLVGGTPCQSFSLAGLRKGLADPRGNLALTFLGIADRYRPEWFIWENVPGVLSQDGGRAFGSILGGLAKLGFGFACRTLDAQYVRVDGFGRAVPQRRRRVFVVGNSRDWRRAAAILLEPESLSGNPSPRREAGQGIAGSLTASTGGSDENDARDGRLIVGTLGARSAAHPGGIKSESDFSVAAFGGNDTTGSIDVATARNGHGGPHGLCDALSGVQAVAKGWAVRRLTPRECERLQGFHDDYTAITYRGKPAADGPRYKALGNSMAVNAMRWLGRRINMVRGLSADLQRKAA